MVRVSTSNLTSSLRSTNAFPRLAPARHRPRIRPRQLQLSTPWVPDRPSGASSIQHSDGEPSESGAARIAKVTVYETGVRPTTSVFLDRQPLSKIFIPTSPRMDEAEHAPGCATHRIGPNPLQYLWVASPTLGLVHLRTSVRIGSSGGRFSTRARIVSQIRSQFRPSAPIMCSCKKL